MRHDFSPPWHRLGKLGLWRLYGNTLPLPINRRYLRYARQHCKVQQGPVWPTRFGDPQVARGMLDATRARACSEAISAAIASGSLKPDKALAFMVAIPRPLDLFGADLLDVFDGPLGDLLRQSYGCEFRVEWIDCYRTYPGERQASWLWHIDNVPPYLAKVLLYLTDSDADTGVTEFIPGGDTRAFMAAGYFGVTRSERAADLAQLAARKGMPYRPTSFRLTAGDAVVFNTNTLHRGGIVTRGYRDVVSMVILPSRVSWRAHFEATGIDRVQSAGSFPRDPLAA
jgi:hypothetical protein